MNITSVQTVTKYEQHQLDMLLWQADVHERNGKRQEALRENMKRLITITLLFALCSCSRHEIHKTTANAPQLRPPIDRSVWANTRDDFGTINGHNYDGVTVMRVEPDGVVVKTKSGIVKLYFSELSQQAQQKYHYDP